MAMLLITKMNMMMRNDFHLLLEREAAIEPHHLNRGLKLQIASIKICLCSNHPSVFQSMCLFVKVSILTHQRPKPLGGLEGEDYDA